GAALLVLLPLPLLIQHAGRPGHGTDMQFAEVALMCALVGLFAPMAVWKGDGPARRGYFWSLPVDRSRHALVKVAAGWGWTMAVVGLLLLWAALLAWMTGGELSLGDTRVPLRPYSEVPRPTPADHFVHPWPVDAWLWIVPFTATTAAYLVGSAVALSTDHPWRWYAGFVLCWALLAAAGLHEELGQLMEGRYGWGVMVTGSEWEQARLTTPAGARVFAGRFVAAPAQWSLATALWMALALSAVVFAARRHQER
ncbi:MAG TPA: hypothetical protein VEY93_16070, partial [Longimicrobium sp.]|nr:hypothetical protein [Longimicrobium sp.]